MNRTDTYDFLSTFGDAAQAVAPEISAAPAVAPPAAPAAGEAMVPVSQQTVAAIIDLATATAARAQAAQKVAEAKAAAPPAPAPVDPDADLKKTIAKMAREQAETNAMLAAMQLENYRVQAVANAHAGGRILVDSLVGGNSPAEIDASIAFAAAEYDLLHQRFLQQQQAQAAAQPAAALPPVAQAPVVADPSTAPAPALQGSVASVAGLSPVDGQQQGAGYVSAPSVPQHTNNSISQEQLAYLTSSEAIRNGTYAQNRSVIMQALRGGQGQAVPNRWSFQAQTPLAPPPAYAQQGAAGAPAPAMRQQNIYSNVTVPQARPAGPMPHQPQQGMHAAPFQPGRAPQPIQLDAGAPLDVGAARAAAEAAIASKRGSNQSPHHQ